MAKTKVCQVGHTLKRGHGNSSVVGGSGRAASKALEAAATAFAYSTTMVPGLLILLRRKKRKPLLQEDPLEHE